MDTLRQRIPFKLSEGEPEESRILDEQEQEEVIEDIRKVHHQSTEYHYKFLQGCLSFMILFHIWFLFLLARQATPIHILFPNSRTPRAPLIPFASVFALLNIVLLVNVVLHLPKELSFPRVIHSIMSRTKPRLPLTIQESMKNLPLSMRWVAGPLFLPVFVSVVNLSDVHQVIWWSSPLLVVGIFFLVTSWIRENETEIERLEKLKYEAKGA